MIPGLVAAPSGRIDALQVLRAVAAISVLIHHLLRSIFISWADLSRVPTSPLLSHVTELLAAGVDMFFVLSGFLMVHISRPYVERRKTVADFLAHRVMRIWPAYAVATTIYLVLGLISYPAGAAYDLQPHRLLSYVFVPTFTQAGLVQPILGVGWTLNYEIFFYLVFALVLWLRRTHLLAGLAVALLAVIVAARTLGDGSEIALFLGDPIMLEFVFGGCIAALYRTGRLESIPPALALAAGILLLLAGGLIENPHEFRFLVRGVPAALIFLGLLRYGNRIRWPAPLLFLGDASYSIYLVHIMIVFRFVGSVYRRFAAAGLEAYWITGALILLFAASLIAGILYYLVVERPLLTIVHAAYRRLGAPMARRGTV